MNAARLIFACVACVASAAAQDAAPSSRTFRFVGRVEAPPGGRVGRAALLDPRGVRAEDAAPDADGRFAVETADPPEGRRIRVDGPGLAPVFFDLPEGLPAGTTLLGERAAEAARTVRAAAPGLRPDDVVVAYALDRARTVDARDEVWRAPVDAERVVEAPLLGPDALLFAVFREEAGSRYAVAAEIAAGSSTEALLKRLTVAAETATFESTCVGARFVGALELPFLAPLRAAPFALRVEGVVGRTAPVGTEASGVVPLPKGATFYGSLRTADGDARVRWIGGAPAIPGRERGKESFAWRIVADATEAPLRDARTTVDAEADPAGPRADDAAGTIVVRHEPAYEPARFFAAPSAGAAPTPRDVRLRARPHVVGAAGTPRPADAAAFYRRRAGAPETLLGPVRKDGLFGPFPIPLGAGELVVRGTAYASRAEALDAPFPEGEVRSAPTGEPAAVVRGVVRRGRDVVPGALVRLVPSDGRDAPSFAELAEAPAWRDAATRARLDDVRARVRRTNDAGAFDFDPVDPGTYVFVVEADGVAPTAFPPVRAFGVAAHTLDVAGARRATPVGTGFARDGDLPLAVERTPFGPVRFGAFALRGGTSYDGFGLANLAPHRRGPPVPRADGSYALELSLLDVERRADAPPLLVWAHAADVAAGGLVATALARPDGETVRLRFSGSGDVVVRLCGPGLPWTTCGPFALAPAQRPGRPVVVDVPRPRRVVARAFLPEGPLAADARVEIEMERDRVLAGAAPPPLSGAVGPDGTLRAPDLPAGRARLTVRAPRAAKTYVIDGVTDELLGDFVLESAPPEPSVVDAGSAAWDADGRRLDAGALRRLLSAGRPVERAVPLPAASTPGAAPGVVRRVESVAEVGPPPSGPPLVLSFSGYVSGTSASLVPLTAHGDVAPGVGLITGSIDPRGDATFDAVPDGRYRALYEGRGGRRSAMVDVRANEPRRVTVPPPQEATFACAAFDGTGQRRLVGARATLRPVDDFAPGAGGAQRALSAVVARDGRAEFVVEAEVRYVLDVVAEEPYAAARTLVGPFPAGKPAPEIEVKLLPADRIVLRVTGGQGPTLPVAGAAVGVFVDGRWWSGARTDVDGRAILAHVPRGLHDVHAAADGYALAARTFDVPGSGSDREEELRLDFAIATPLRFGADTSGEEGVLIVPRAGPTPLDPRAFGREGRLAALVGQRPNREGEVVLEVPAGGDLELRVFRRADDEGRPAAIRSGVPADAPPP
jgi:hypothetical protein